MAGGFIGVNVLVPKLSGLRVGDLLKLLKFHAEDIAKPILKNIENRSTRDTGSMIEDETYQLGGSGNTIVQWYLGDEYQAAVDGRGRYYGQYQEGPPLGIPGYTASGSPVEMFNKVTYDDLPLIETWATDVVREGIDNVLKGLVP